MVSRYDDDDVVVVLALQERHSVGDAIQTQVSFSAQLGIHHAVNAASQSSCCNSHNKLLQTLFAILIADCCLLHVQKPIITSRSVANRTL
jgi:hypothetical protein